MKATHALVIGFLGCAAGAGGFYWGNALVASGARSSGDFLGVAGLVAGLTGLYFLFLGALRLKN